MHSLVLLNVYYGKFNNYFNLWLKSAAFNPTVDFIIITDNHTLENCPSNIKFIQMPFEQVYQRFQKLFDFKIRLHPYKLCDYKPVYGEAFSDMIKGYDFWGYCDLDLIFGDIRRFLTEDIMESCEQILQRGHFTLFKNNTKCNRLYLKTVDKDNMAYPYDKVFKTGHSCYFDEYIGMGIVADLYCDKIFRDQKIENVVLDVPPYRYELYSDICKKEYYCEWVNGQLFRYLVDDSRRTHPQEFMYIHLQKRNMKIEFAEGNIDNINRFYILADKFALTSDYCITQEMRLNKQKKDKLMAIKRVCKKFLQYGPIAGIKHKIQMKKTINWLDKNNPQF